MQGNRVLMCKFNLKSMWLAALTTYFNVVLSVTKIIEYTFIALSSSGKISNRLNKLIFIYETKPCDSITGLTQKNMKQNYVFTYQVPPLVSPPLERGARLPPPLATLPIQSAF